MSAALALSSRQQVIASWRAGVLSLPDDRLPCPGLIWLEPGPHGRPGVWVGVRTMMLRFVEHGGEEAAALGWVTESLFGVHRLAGAMGADSTGALVTLYPRKVIALGERTIVLERNSGRQTSRGMSNTAESITLWRFNPSA